MVPALDGDRDRNFQTPMGRIEVGGGLQCPSRCSGREIQCIYMLRAIGGHSSTAEWHATHDHIWSYAGYSLRLGSHPSGLSRNVS